MRKNGLLIILLVFMMLFSLTACGQDTATQPDISTRQEVETETSQTDTVEETEDTTEPDANSTQNQASDTTDTKVLIAFFSRADENYGVGVVEKGSTQIVAEMIAEETGGDLFHIQTVTPYPADYDECTEVAKQEQEDNARPELDAEIQDFDSFDVVYLGYPIWWGDMPMPVYTFLESYDFTGKTIVPFATHEGSGLSTTENSIKDSCSSAEVLGGFAVRGAVAQNAQEDAKDAVVNWLREGGFIE